jgi:Tfp pilus assembly pilus retraction ATPase PilT
MYCVNEIATAATTAKASDIHLREGSEPYFRCGGTLIASGFAPYLTKGALAELRNYANEGDVSEAGFEIAEVRAPSSVFGARWRVAVFAESAVLRHISDLPL